MEKIYNREFAPIRRQRHSTGIAGTHAKVCSSLVVLWDQLFRFFHPTRQYPVEEHTTLMRAVKDYTKPFSQSLPLFLLVQGYHLLQIFPVKQDQKLHMRTWGKLINRLATRGSFTVYFVSKYVCTACHWRCMLGTRHHILYFIICWSYLISWGTRKSRTSRRPYSTLCIETHTCTQKDF